MGGRMYLGNQLVTPVIVAGKPYIGLPLYRVENGVAAWGVNDFVGDEFNGITEIGERGLTGMFFGLLYEAIIGYDPFENLSGTVNFSDLITIKERGLAVTFYDAEITNAYFPKLETIEEHGLDTAFGRTPIEDIDFHSLKTVGDYGMYCTFFGARDESFPKNDIVFDSLEYVGECGMQQTFDGCSFDKNVSFPKLKTIKANGLNSCFGNCYPSNIYFNALTTSSFVGGNNQLAGLVSSYQEEYVVTIHFPSNLQSTISGLTGYPLFGGTSGYVTLAFDLPATS